MDYSATISVSASPEAANHAIRREMHKWWSRRVELSDHGATIRFNNSHVNFDFDPQSETLTDNWICTDAHMIIEDVAYYSEWKGTALEWKIVPKGTGSRITLTHRGLNEKLECLDVCRRGWESYFEQSLKNYLDGDAATPSLT